MKIIYSSDKTAAYLFDTDLHILSESSSRYGLSINRPLPGAIINDCRSHYCTCGKGWCPKIPSDQLCEMVRLALPHGATRVIIRDPVDRYRNSTIECLPVIDVSRLFGSIRERVSLTDGYYLFFKEN